MDAGTLELVELDDTILDHTPDCEEFPFAHTMGACTHTVTHRLIGCQDSCLVCFPAMLRNKADLDSPAWGCRNCRGKCMRIEPV